MECVRRSSHEGPLHYLQLVSQLVLTDVVNCDYPTEIYLEVTAPKFKNLDMMVSKAGISSSRGSILRFQPLVFGSVLHD